ncbi:hypothetical protein HKD37_01G001380 [Glycine soja]
MKLTKKKVLQTIGERWRQFKSDLMRKLALAADKDGMDDISKEKWTQFCQTHRDPSWEFGSTEGVIDPPSPIRRHVKWKMVRTKKVGQMTSEVAKEIAENISQFQSQMQSQGLALPLEPEVGPSVARVSTKESCVDPLGNDPQTGDLDKCGLYIEDNPSRLVALGRVYEGSTMIHNIPLLHGQVKVVVEEIKDADTLVPVPTDEIILVGQTLNTFLAWPTHLVKPLSEHEAVSPAKPPDRPDPEMAIPYI